MNSPWRVRLAQAAQDDFAAILRWTGENFGPTQARAYAKTLRSAPVDLTRGPHITGCRRRDYIGTGIHTLHVARRGRKGRHFVVFRIDSAAQTIDVLRLLHDSMDLPQHLPTARGE